MSRSTTLDLSTVRSLLLIGAVSLVALLAYVPTAQAQSLLEQIEAAEAELNDLASIVSEMNGGEVLGATAPAPTPVRPVCRISLDKKSYKVGDVARITWSTTGAETVQLVSNPVGLKSINTDEQVEKRGTVSVTITEAMVGVATAAVKATSKTGHEVTCLKYGAILYTADSALNAKLAPLNAKIAQLTYRQNALRLQLEKAEALLSNNVDEVAYQQSLIDALMANPPADAVEKPTIEFVDATVTVTADDADTSKNKGEYEIKFDVVAVDTDMYIAKTAARGAKVAGANYRIMGADGAAVGVGAATAALSSTAPVEGDYYKVGEGEVESFTLTVTYDPVVNAFYKLGLLRVNWNDTAAVADSKLTAQPLGDFESDMLSI